MTGERFRRFRNSRFWKPLGDIYRKSGLKARVYSHSINPPVKTCEIGDFLARTGSTRVPVPKINYFEPAAWLKPESGPMPAEDVEALARITIHFQPARIFEFGTNWGVSTATFLLNTPATTKIWTLDICRELRTNAEIESSSELQAMLLGRDEVGSAYKTITGSEMRVAQIFQDSLRLDWRDTNAPPFFDLILVDACHQYDFVKSDTIKAVERLAPGGLLVWHDYYPDVSAWGDVFKFVNEFSKAHDNVTHLRNTHIAVWQKPA